MIGSDATISERIIGDWREVTNWAQANPENTPLLARILESAVMPSFPGGVLPWPRPGKKTIFYGVARKPEEWRRLRPLLIAFAGPTLTNFFGAPEVPDPKWGPEKLLASKDFHAVARLVPGDDAEAERITARSLARLCQMLSTNVVAGHRPPEPTSRLLGRLEGALADGDRAGALGIYAQLHAESRLDALNLKFLEIEIAAAFRDWPTIVAMPELSDLIASPRPTAVTATMLEALYSVYIAPAEEEGRAEEAYAEIRHLTIELLAGPRLRLEAGGTRLADLEDALHRRSRIAEALPQPEPPALETKSAADVAFAALVGAARSDSLQALRNAIELIEGLAPSEQEQLLAPAWIRELWRTVLTRTEQIPPPRNWVDWIALLPRKEFANAIEVARRGAVEWSIDEELSDPADAEALSRALTEVPDGLASERLCEGLPVLIGWLRRDQGYPRPSLREVYQSIWTLLVLGVRRGGAELEASAALFDGLLASGLSAIDYKNILSDALDLAGEPGRKTAYWFLSLTESTVDYPAPDDEARSAFWASAVGRLDKLRPQLTPLQQVAIERLAKTLGISIAALDEEPLVGVPIRTAFKGKSLAIYTLTESAGKQAEEALRRVAPEMNISLHTDHVGSARLRAAAEHADLFVIVTWSAKHAATDFIRRHRPSSRPLLFAPGRGASAILRVLDEHVRQG